MDRSRAASSIMQSTASSLPSAEVVTTDAAAETEETEETEETVDPEAVVRDAVVPGVLAGLAAIGATSRGVWVASRPARRRTSHASLGRTIGLAAGRCRARASDGNSPLRHVNSERG